MKKKKKQQTNNKKQKKTKIKKAERNILNFENFHKNSNYCEEKRSR